MDSTSFFIRRILICLLVLGLGNFSPAPVDAADPAVIAAIQKKVKKLKAKLKKATKIPVASRKRKKVKRFKKKLKKARFQLFAASQVPDPVLVPPSGPFMEFVTVGDAGNANDPSDGDAETMMEIENFGAVGYEFQIGKYEVTIGQYVQFLNAVATEDTYEVYSTGMEVQANTAGIARTGSLGNWSYSAIGSENKPVTYVNWFDAARFCNWLHNGRPAGAQDASTTEDGAYLLNGATTGVIPTHEGDALYWIPAEDEWYKAAYFDPRDEADGGPEGDDHYWVYPTQNDFDPPVGNLIGSDPHQCNFRIQGTNLYSVTQDSAYDAMQNYLTNVGTYTGSPGFYGTFDMGGNLREWTDGVKSGEKVFRGGMWNNNEGGLRAQTRDTAATDYSDNITGFRVAAPAPGP